MEQLKTLNFCLTQIAENPKIDGSIKEPYKIVALLAIDNIVTLLDEQSER
jgi:hypothetical protein